MKLNFKLASFVAGCLVLIVFSLHQWQASHRHCAVCNYGYAVEK
jgi:hypothetical protein